MGRIYDLEARLITFSSDILEYASTVTQNDAGKYLGNQITRASLAAALIYGEAQAAESRKDFKHKTQIILKELREVQIAIKIIEKNNLARGNHESILDESSQLVAIFATIVKKVKSRV